MYSTYYRTPRLYMSGYQADNQPLAPQLMMEDIVGDYKDKTVTLEDFPFFANNIKMASVHPCKHAAVMKTLLDRADAALRLRKERLKAGMIPRKEAGMEGLVEDIKHVSISGGQTSGGGADDWEEIQHEGDDSDVAIRVDQYLVVFLKACFHVPVAGAEHQRANTCCSLVHCQRHAGHRARFHNGRLVKGILQNTPHGKVAPGVALDAGHAEHSLHRVESLIWSESELERLRWECVLVRLCLFRLCLWSKRLEFLL